MGRWTFDHESSVIVNDEVTTLKAILRWGLYLEIPQGAVQKGGY